MQNELFDDKQFGTDWKQLENDVIGYMRTAIANFDTDPAVVHTNYSKAHELFVAHLVEWSEAFGDLYNQMLAIYNACFPKEKGHYRTSHVGIGYSSFPVHKWVPDKVQPPKPIVIELVARFDVLIQAWNGRAEHEVKKIYSDGSEKSDESEESDGCE